MPPRPSNTLRVSRAAARRSLLARSITLSGRGFLWGAVAAGAAVAITKLSGNGVSWALLCLPPIALGGATGLVVAWIGRWSDRRAAGIVDQRLGLKDRLTTALALERDTGPFAQWSMSEAEHAAASAQVARIIPVKADWTWGAWPVLGALVIAASLYIPVMNWARPRPAQQAQRQSAAEQLQQVSQVLNRPDPQSNQPLASPEQLKALQDLEKELVSGKADPQDAREHAARELAESARRLEVEAKTTEAAAAKTRDSLTQAATTKSGAGSESPITDALRRGDLKAASDTAEELGKTLPTMSAEERQALARELDELAKAIEAEQVREEQAKDPEASGEAPRQQDPKADQAPERHDPTKPRTHSSNTSESDKQEPSRDEGAEEESQRKIQDLTESLRDAAKELRGEEPPARDKPSLKDRPESQPPKSPKHPERDRKGEGPTGSTGATGPKTPEPGATGSTGSTSPSGATGTTGSQDATGSRGSSGASGAAGSTGASGTTRAQGATGSSGQTGASGTSGTTGPSQSSGTGSQAPSGASGASGASGQTGATQPGPTGQTGATGVAGVSGATGQSGSRPPGSPSGSSGATGPSGPTGSSGTTGPSSPTGSSQPRPGTTGPTSYPSGATGQSGLSGSTGQPAGTGAPTSNAPETGERTPSMEQLRKNLRDMADAGRRAQQSRKQAEHLKDMARKMYEEATPEQRKELDKLVQDMQRDSGEEPGTEPQPMTRTEPKALRSPNTEPVDARPKPPTDRPAPGERVIAEWFSNRAGNSTGTAAATEDLRRAADSAERAIEQQVVPPRYNDLIKRVFKRYSEQASGAPAASPPAR
jgi:hypothetical protein